MRVLVCGGRNYDDRQKVIDTLFDLNEREGPIACIIEGGASGADKHARSWATITDTACEHYRADWESFGAQAGPRRNARMLSDGKPDVVIAFPGGRGTADMVRQAKAAGIEVREIT